MTPDPRARFELLWAQHGRAVLRYAQRRAAPGDVDDVVAETFVVAWRRIDEVPPHALPWLLAVARGVAANTRRGHLRRQALHQRLTAHDERAAGGPRAPGTEGPDAVDAVHAALALLTPGEREALTLLAWDGLTRAEAAEALGCTRAALAVRVHRARRRLAAALGPAPAQPPPAAGRHPASPCPADATGGAR